MARPARRQEAEPSHLIARRQQEDAARAERRAREDALIRQYHRAENAKAKLEARRDTDLAKLEQRMRSIRGTAAAKIAEVKKEVARVVADLKTDHTAEEAAPLLALTVDQYNNILYNGHARTTPFRPDASKSDPAAASDTADTSTTVAAPSPVDGAHSSDQFTLFAGADAAPSSPSGATLPDPHPLDAPTREGTAAEPTSTGPENS